MKRIERPLAVTRELAKEIHFRFFGSEANFMEGFISFMFRHGEITLQVCKEMTSSRCVCCRVFLFGQSIGYCYYDVTTEEFSRLWKDD